MEQLEREIKLQQEIEELKKVNVRILRKLETSKVSKEELVEAVFLAAKDAASNLEIPYGKPKKDQRKKTAETAVAVLSDWQLAKATPDYPDSRGYSTAECEKRIEEYADKVAQLTEIQRADHPVKDLRVWLIGDLVEGELIFPGQSHLIDASLYRQVTVDGPRILGGFLAKMLDHFDSIHVVGVIGNHGALGGRSRRDYSPETNADRMLYRIVQQIYAKEKRITWDIPDGPGDRNWYGIDTVGNKKALLFHGDQIRGGFAGMPWYGFNKKVLGWAVGAIPEDFDYAVCGHWHQPTSFVLNTKLVYVNGSTESNNTYAQEQLAAVGFPCQWLLFMHPENGVTAEYRVWLDRG